VFARDTRRTELSQESCFYIACYNPAAWCINFPPAASPRRDVALRQQPRRVEGDRYPDRLKFRDIYFAHGLSLREFREQAREISEMVIRISQWRGHGREKVELHLLKIQVDHRDYQSASVTSCFRCLPRSQLIVIPSGVISLRDFPKSRILAAIGEFETASFPQEGMQTSIVIVAIIMIRHARIRS